MGLTLLLIEADRHTQNLITGLLEAEGHVLVSEPDAEWALRIFEKRFFQAVLLGTPIGEKSLDMARAIRKTLRGKKTPILLLAGSELPAAVSREAKSQLDLHEVLEKPVKPVRLLQALKGLKGLDKPAIKSPIAKIKITVRKPADYAGPESRKELEDVERDANLFKDASWQGKLEELPMPNLLGKLHQMGADGTLLIKRDRRKKLITFGRGDPVFIKSNNLGECLGRLLVRAEIISDEECVQSLEIMRESGHKQGLVLLEMGLISPNTLKRVLDRQFRLKLFDLFSWRKGVFMFRPDSSESTTHAPSKASTAELILTGIERHFSKECINKALKKSRQAYLAPNKNPMLRFQNMNLDEESERFISTLQGQHSIAELIKGAKNAEHVSRLIYALLCAGMFQANQHPETPVWDEEEETAEVTDENRPLANNVDPELVPDLSSEGEASSLALPTSGLTQIRESLALQIQKAEEKNFYDRLGIPRNASKTRITKAFFEKARQHHPDQQERRESTQVRLLSVELFESFCEAHDVLSNDLSRKNYEQEMLPVVTKAATKNATKKKKTPASQKKPKPVPAEPKTKPKPDLAAQSLRAEKLFRLGKAALNKGDTQNAVKQLTDAVRLFPEEGEYLAELGLATLRDKPKDHAAQEQARDHLNTAVTLSPRLDIPHLYLGYVYQAMGQAMMAFDEFQKAIECNPYCTEAMREIRLSRMRSKAKKKGRGLFGLKR
ncbi:MAG: DnaJ domain-containing protein [Deltaproteobacteria bacterium]|nr:DnaJ domain-containing protein [Deltaproteobacteria bacterium]